MNYSLFYSNNKSFSNLKLSIKFSSLLLFDLIPLFLFLISSYSLVYLADKYLCL